MDTQDKTILIIDKMDESRRRLAALLQECGHGAVQQAASLAEASTLIPGHLQEGTAAPELLLVDLNLLDQQPHDGAWPHLAGKAASATIPIILLVSDLNHAALQAGLPQGAMDVLRKPVHPVELRARIQCALARQAEMARNQSLHRQLDTAAMRLQHSRRHDDLTDLANRLFFDEFLDQEWRRCRRDQHPITLCLADLDFFKAYNSRQGREQGDACLQRVATILAATIKRPADLAARYSGDQFAIILTETPAEGGCAVAERLRRALAARQIPHPHSAVSPWLTLSCGIASLTPKAGTTVHDLTSQAERALFEAKHRGRNRMVCPGLRARPAPPS